jgi:pectinesterase
MLNRATRLLLLGFLLIAPATLAADEKGKPVAEWKDVPDEWFTSDEGKLVITNIISWQHSSGGWYKTYNTLKPKPADYAPTNHPLAMQGDNADVWARSGTIDNDATYTELRLLARAVHLTKREDALASFNKGLQFLFDAQYSNGGFPQRYPLPKNYGRHITFNDGAMVGVMKLLKDASTGAGDFDFLTPEMQKKCGERFTRGVDCLVKLQIKRDGKLTVWGQQHDPETLAPASARTYELPSYCSTESTGITQLLMQIENPSDEVKAAVNGAVAWFESTKIPGKRYDKLSGPQYEKGFERRVVDDPASNLWARFYDLENVKPLFVDRDGSIHTDVQELGYERRTGYAWYSSSPNSVLKAYPKWKAKNGG